MAKKITYSEEQLVELLSNKDQAAFSYLYDNYYRALFIVIFTITKNKELAEDVLQNVFVKIWDNFAKYERNKGRLYTWMLNIARNTAIDSLRNKHEKVKSNIQEADDFVYYKNQLFVENTNHNTIGLKSVLSSLTDEQQQIIDLAYFQGYSQSEIAEKLNAPLGTIKTKIRQTLLELREKTKE